MSATVDKALTEFIYPGLEHHGIRIRV